MRIWNVAVSERLDNGSHLRTAQTVEAASLVEATQTVQATIDEQPDHAHRYEIVGVQLVHELE